MGAPTTRLSDCLYILFVATGKTDKAEAVKQAAERFYGDPTLIAQQFGQWLVAQGVITHGELDQGLAARGSEMSLFDAATPEQQKQIVMRVRDRASCAIENAEAVLARAGK